MPNPRHDALALAGDLPGVLLDAHRLAASAPGMHGRRRAGQGEDFWQYRDHRPEDGARLVDWRRSARGERLYVRERERQAAQTAWFWIDPSPAFNWSSDFARPTKLYRAHTLALALAILLVRGGERVGVLGQPARTGARAVDRLALDLCAPLHDVAAPTRACIVFASDFYAPLETWTQRLEAAASAGASGALAIIADPAEEEFPFRGRALFQTPGFPNSGAAPQALIGRAEAARGEYLERLRAHRRGISALGASLGFPALTHRTDHSAAPALAALIALVAESGV